MAIDPILKPRPFGGGNVALSLFTRNAARRIGRKPSFY
jgi:hypothetical protein